MPVPGLSAPTNLEVAAAVAAWLLVLEGAGWLTTARLLAGHGRLERWAVRPVAGLASLFVFHQLADLSGIPITPLALAAWLMVSGAVTHPVWVHLGRHRPPIERDPEPRWCRWALAGVAAMAIVLWFTAVTGPRVAPAQADNARHGFFVARILATGTNDPTGVLVDDVRSGEYAATYYPLALHTSAAVIVETTDLPIPAVLSGLAIAVSSAILVPGLGLLTLRLTGDAATAVVGALTGSLALPFPFEPFDWGGLPMVAGLCAVPVTAVLLERAAGSGRSVATAALAAVVLTGCYGAHNTQALVAVALGLALVASNPAMTIRSALRHWRPVAAFVGAACAWDLIGFARGIGERTGAKVLDEHGALAFARFVVTFGADRPLVPVLVNVVALVGLVMLWRRGFAAVVGLVGALLTLCLLAAQWQTPLVRALTLPWYGFANRLSTTAQLLLAPAIATAAMAGLRRLPRPPVAGGLVALLVLPGLSTMWLLRAQGASAIGPEQLAAFEHLAATSEPGTAVLTEEADDGGMWMYALADVTPLFGFPVEYHEPGPYWASNLELLELVADPTSDPEAVRVLAQRRCVSQVFATDHPNAPTDRTMRRDRLRQAPFLTEELALATVSIFRIDGVATEGCVPEVLS